MKFVLLLLVVGIIFYCSEHNVFKKLKQKGGDGGDVDKVPMIMMGLFTIILGGGVAAYFLLFDDKTCKGFTCPANSSVKTTAISKGKAGSGKPVSCKGDCTIKTCCVCAKGYEFDKTGKKCVSKKKTPKTCDTFKECKTEYTPKSNPKTINCDDKKGCDKHTCCDCNSGYKLDTDKKTCVPKKCSEFLCKSGYKKISDADKIPCDDQEGCNETKCCEKSNTSTTCDNFNKCGSGIKKRPGAANTKCNNDVDCKKKCCETAKPNKRDSFIVTGFTGNKEKYNGTYEKTSTKCEEDTAIPKKLVYKQSSCPSNAGETPSPSDSCEGYLYHIGGTGVPEWHINDTKCRKYSPLVAYSNGSCTVSPDQQECKGRWRSIAKGKASQPLTDLTVKREK